LSGQSVILCDDVHRALSYHDEVGLCVAMSDHGSKLRNSVRSTNVYEERSLGISEDENDDQENEADHPESDSGVAVWGRYLGRHVRRQLSFGTPTFFKPARVYKMTDVQICGGSPSRCFLFASSRYPYTTMLNPRAWRTDAANSAAS